MTSNITTTRTMRGNQLTVGDFRRLFEGASDDTVPDIAIDSGDRFGSATTRVTVAIDSNTFAGRATSARTAVNDPFGDREATR